MADNQSELTEANISIGLTRNDVDGEIFSLNYDVKVNDPPSNRFSLEDQLHSLIAPQTGSNLIICTIGNF